MLPETITLRCDDVARSVSSYIDGELVAEERAAVDQHVAGCKPCRRLLDDEAALKSMIRAHLRPTPPAPVELRGRVLAALDAAEASHQGPVTPLYRRALPFAAVFAAAAAMTIFVSTGLRTRPARAALVEDAVSAHEKALPLEVGGDAQQVSGWMQGKVAVKVKPPTLPRLDDRPAWPAERSFAPASLRGARLGHLSRQDAAQLSYDLGGASVTVHIFDPTGVRMSAPRRHEVGAHVIYSDSMRGYSVVFFADRGVGYAFTSDLREEDLVELVSRTLE
jgi:anti-sigma factor (TIGR02949 family)